MKPYDPNVNALAQAALVILAGPTPSGLLERSIERVVERWMREAHPDYDEVMGGEPLFLRRSRR